MTEPANKRSAYNHMQDGYFPRRDHFYKVTALK